MLQERSAIEDEAAAVVQHLAWRAGHRLTEDDDYMVGYEIDATAISWVGGIRLRPDGGWSLIDGLDSVEFGVREKTNAGRVLAAVYSGFFDAAAEGVALVPVERIKECYHASVKENYPEAGRAFIRFATSYWTLKVLVRHLDVAGSRRMSRHILKRVDDLIYPLYFPLDGLFQIPADQRERDIALSLKSFGPKIDAADFLKRNPILLRQRNRGGS